MASIIDICNLGLSHIGSDAQVASISPPDGSVEAGHCARLWPIVRTELFESAAWTFSKARVLLAAVTNPSTVWAYAYGLPSNSLSPLRVLKSFVLSSYGFVVPYTYGYVSPSELAIFDERGSADFEVEGTTLLTNEPSAVLLYVQDVTDPSRYSPSFVVAAGYLMASYLAGPLIKGTEGATAGAKFRQVGMAAAAAAATKDANNSSEPASFVSDAIRART